MTSSKTARRKRKRDAEKRALKAASATNVSSLSLQAKAAFDLEASAGNGQTIPKFSLVAYNGGKMKPQGFRYPVIVNLSGVEYDDSVPAFLDHETTGRGVVGHASVIVTDNAIMADGVVSGDTEAASTVVSSAKKGFPWQVSIGAAIGEKEFVKSGEFRQVNGQNHQGPFYHIVNSQLHELSFVPIGADRTTSAAIAAQTGGQDMAEDAKTPEEEQRDDLLANLDPAFEKWLTAQGFDPKELNEQQFSNLELGYKKLKEDLIAQAEAASPEAIREKLRQETVAEMNRQVEIRKICKHNPILASRAIGEGWDVQRTELEQMKEIMKVAPQSPAPSHGHKHLNTETITAALCMQSQIEARWLDDKADHWRDMPGQKGFSEETLDAASDLGQYSFSRLFHEFLFANGISVSPGLTTLELIPKVKDAYKTLKASTGFSTLDLSGILSNVMGKSMLAMFDTVRPVAQRLSASRSVRDFKETKAFRLTGNGDFLPLGPTGELQNMQLQEEEYANKPSTRGRMITISREMLINDDLGALNSVTRVLGRKAALSLQKEFFTLWVDLENQGFFAAGNNNLINNPLGIPGLTAAEQTYYDQVDADQDPIDIEAQTLLVPTALKVTAEELMNDTTTMVWDRDTAATTTTKQPQMNPHAGKWNIEWSPWLNKLLAADQDTAWWLIAPPNVLAAMEIVYINGRTTPYIESEDSDFSTLGFQWRSYYDFGIAQQDYRAAVKSTGTGP